MPLVLALLGISLILGLRAKRVDLGVGTTLFVATIAVSVTYLIMYFRL